MLRVVGPVYQFRHVDLQHRLARSRTARPPLFRPGVENAALAWVAARCPRPHEGTCRVAWWRIPAWAPASPRVLVIGVAGGVLTWLGLGLLDPGLLLSVAGALIACAAGVSATVGAGLLDARLAGADEPPAHPLSAVRRPGLCGAALGLGFAIDLSNVIPPTATMTLSAGLISGAALWLLLGVVVALGRGDAALRRWRGITTDRPLSSGLVLGATVGYLAATATSILAASPTGLDRQLQVDAVVHLAVSATLLVVGLRIGSGAAAAPGAGDPPDPFASWHRRRRAQLLAWLVGGALGGGFVVRSGIRAVQSTLRSDSTGTAVVMLVVALVLAAAWGLLLGLLFPATWRTSLACVQLRLQHPVPVRLVRLLEDARSGGRVQAAGPWFLVPRVPEPDAPAPSPAPAGPS